MIELAQYTKHNVTPGTYIYKAQGKGGRSGIPVKVFRDRRGNLMVSFDNAFNTTRLKFIPSQAIFEEVYSQGE